MSAVRSLDAGIRMLSDDELAKSIDRLRNEIADGADLLAEQITVPCFALTTEAVRRALGLAFYDVQLLAGLVLSTGAIAEMKTGEGKTLVVALPAVLRALGGQGVHVATVNHYLADRDYHQLRPVFELLNLSVGLVREKDAPEKKRAAYDCDITYATGYQLGFDYLHDQVALRRRRELRLGRELRQKLHGEDEARRVTLQRGHAFAIIDEIDSVLIDEASTPLILSGPPARRRSQPAAFQRAREVADQLVAKEDYILENLTSRITLTEQGFSQLRGPLAWKQREGLARPWATYVEQALRARLVLNKDVDYVVREDAVHIVDQNTGRIFAERKWRDGLHQAVEAKEQVFITDETCSLARISRQRYFRLYDKMCGMTGTAIGNEKEFRGFYGLSVVDIPLRKTCQRLILPARYFKDQDHKWDAVAVDIVQRHQAGQPVLVGTRTIQSSLSIAKRLDALNLPYRILNGIQDDEEAGVVAEAGQLAAVTIATNMAGRGTDIKLAKQSAAVGGLHVIATEFHESPRIDRQLIGRAARQGDPGSCQFMVAADDDLILRYHPALASQMRRTAGEQGEVINDYANLIARVQQKCEQRNYERRCQLLREEKWLEGVISAIAKPD